MAQRLVIIEDNIQHFSSSKRLLEKQGHTVVNIYRSLPESLQAIPLFGEKGITGAIVDGNLSYRDISGQDGAAIARRIRSFWPQIWIASWSSDSCSWGDVHISKGYSEQDAIALVEAVNALMRLNRYS